MVCCKKKKTVTLSNVYRIDWLIVESYGETSVI